MNNPKPRTRPQDPAPAPKSPALSNPRKPGEPAKPTDPDFGQSVEAGGVD